MIKCELYHDNFQNFKRYDIHKAQLVIADIPYNIGADAYANTVKAHGKMTEYATLAVNRRGSPEHRIGRRADNGN